MYEDFFHLNRKPFDLLPNPDFLYMSRSHKRALSYLDYGIRERVGFILLTGEVGSGKTTIIRNLIKKHHNNVILSKIFNTRVDSEQLIAMINDDFGLPIQNKDKITMLRDLNSFLIDHFVKGNQPVLIIDEAQNLEHDLLEEIRMLSNLETDNAKLLQIILVGQPELRKTLASSTLVQLRQRISINCNIEPLSRLETGQYIMHRMEMAGDRNAAVFSEETLNIIHTYSRGIPRLINIICDFILLAAFAEGTTTIESGLVQDIIGDLDFEHHFWGSETAVAQVPHREDLAGYQSAGTEKVFSSLIKEINERLDNLGSDNGSRKMMEEMTAKIEAMEQTIKSHQDKTGNMIQDIYRKIPAVKNSQKRLAPEPPTKSFLGKVFGGMFRF